MRSFGAKAGATTLMALLLAVPSASAATEAGDDCAGNTVEANRTMIAWNSGGFSMNRMVGESGGVITGWRVRVEPGQAPMPERLETYRTVNEVPEEIRKEAESSLEMVREGDNFFKTRIPVQPATQLGVYGPEGTFACNTGESLVTGSFEGSAAVGEIRGLTGMFGFRAPVVAVVEPDADNDGYGDETQDRCQQSAGFQSDCPPVDLSARASAGKRLILVRVKASGEASVHVFGQISWRVRQKPNRGAGRAARTVGLTVGLSGGTKILEPGHQATLFRVPLPKSVLRRLGRIAPMESLKAKITASATDLAGQVTDRRLTVKLKGRDTRG